MYNQTSSSIEQFALAEFIASGGLRRHIKKMRRRYAVKNTLLRTALANIFGSKASIMAYESGLHIRLAVHAAATAEELAQKAMSKGIHILPVKAAESSSPEILLSFAGIAEEDIEPALKKVWGL